jgi:uncharacterized membrane protein
MLRELVVTKGARDDARAGLDSAEDRIVAAQGPRPEFDPVKNPEHGRLAQALDRVRIGELREDVVAAEDVAEKQPNTWGLNLGLASGLAVEVVGALLIARSLGLAPSERIPLGAALAAGLVALTIVIGHGSAKAAEHGARPASVGDRLGHTLRRVLAIVAYIVVVAAVSAVRLRATVDDEASTIDALAETAIFAVMSIGPAWIVAWLAAKRAPAVAAKARVRALRGRLRRAERDQKRAECEVERIAQNGVRWDREAARHRARYRTAHRLERARVDREREEEAPRVRTDENPIG